MEIFKIENLCLEYDKNKPILKDVSLTINQGEFVSIIGPNGCGKSTLIKSLARILNYKKSYKRKIRDFILRTNLRKFFSEKKIKELEQKCLYDENKNEEYKEPFLLRLINKILHSKFLIKMIPKNLVQKMKTKQEELNNKVSIYGNIYFLNKDLYSYNSKEYAKKVSYVPQIIDFPNDTTVYDFVKMGRYPYTNYLGINDKESEELIDRAIKLVNLEEYRNQYLNDLSGGQRQRALLALSLAQDTDTIILDEPTNHLDVRYQLEIIHLLHDLNHNFNKTIILVIHDINHAMKFSDKMIVMKDGKICYFDQTDKIVNKEVIKEIFDVNAEIITSQDRKIISDYWIDNLKTLDEYHNSL